METKHFKLLTYEEGYEPYTDLIKQCVELDKAIYGSLNSYSFELLIDEAGLLIVVDSDSLVIGFAVLEMSCWYPMLYIPRITAMVGHDELYSEIVDFCCACGYKDYGSTYEMIQILVPIDKTAICKLMGKANTLAVGTVFGDECEPVEYVQFDRYVKVGAR